jgi:hypothetical protein
MYSRGEKKHNLFEEKAEEVIKDRKKSPEVSTPSKFTATKQDRYDTKTHSEFIMSRNKRRLSNDHYITSTNKLKIMSSLNSMKE